MASSNAHLNPVRTGLVASRTDASRAFAVAMFSWVWLAFTTGAADTFVVTTNSDSGPGSLRQALTDAATVPGNDTITFDAALSGATIVLSNELTISDSFEVTVDASSLPRGMTLSGGNACRIFRNNSITNVAMLGLTFTGGNGVGWNSGAGGAILAGGRLALTRCTLSSNTATIFGGAVWSAGESSLSLTQCTFFGNEAPAGGGIYTFGARLALVHCTLSGNSAGHGSLSAIGGGIYARSIGNSFMLANSIVSGNAAGSGADIYNEGPLGPSTLTLVGSNIVWSLANSGGATVVGPAVINAMPLLAPLGNNGGPTPTMALRPGSPARDAAVDSSITNDQRGFSIVGLPDIGAFETQVPSGPPHLTGLAPLGGGGLRFSFTNTPGATFTVLATTNVALPSTNWNALGPAVESAPGWFEFTEPATTNTARRFYQIRWP